MARKMIVAYVEVENVMDRTWRHAASAMTVDQIIAEGRRPIPKRFHDGGRTPEGRLRYWCGADKPDTSDMFQVAPVYRTSKVDAEAQCEHCGIGIWELQEALTDAISEHPSHGVVEKP